MVFLYNFTIVANFEDDFTSAVSSESPINDCHAQKLPTLRVNSNDLNWHKEQKGSKDSVLLQAEMSGNVVRISTSNPTKKVSTFYIPAVEDEDSPPVADEVEEVKAAKLKVAIPPTLQTAPTTFELFCECGNLCDKENSICKACMEKKKPVEFSGHLYTQVYSGLKLCWFRLLNKELYCNSNATNKKVTMLKKTQNTSNCFN